MDLRSVPPIQYLNHFIEVYGNRYKCFHFLAMRFKRPIMTYKVNTLHSSPIEVPNNSILFLRGKCPPIQKHPDQNILIFTDNVLIDGIFVNNTRYDTLLRQLFPSDKILFSFFKSDILFLVATENPFSLILIQCRKDSVLRSLYHYMEAYQKSNPLTLEQVSQLRFFKRYDGTLKLFNRWSSFAFELCRKSCYLTTLSNPSAYLGKETCIMLKRSNLPLGPLPPPDFYQCEIFYTHTEPVGVAYFIVKKEGLQLEYVSPMVVTDPKCAFRDTGSVICNAWLPFYQNSERWYQYGLPHYIQNFQHKRLHLKLVVSWLQLQTSEKYKLLYMDLVQVSKIVIGN